MTTAAEDPRALLKAARKDRRITHPHASYTSNGSLLCNLCSCSIKSEAAWGAHLHSTGHTLRLSREQDARRSEQPSASTNGKKRKASIPEETALEERKKLKGLEYMAKGVDVTQQPNHLEKSPSTWSEATVGQRPNASTPVDLSSEAHERQAPKDESAELDALEADLAALEKEARATVNPQANPTNAHPASRGQGSATISAPAVTAEQLAAQDREQQSAQRGKRDAELEDEREEAAVRLEEEFEEMKGYEDRVKRLRERREMVRKGMDAGSVETTGAGGDAGAPAAVDAAAQGGGNEEEDEDDEEDYDEWGFGRE